MGLYLEEDDEDNSEEIKEEVAAAFEPVEEYISAAHDGDIEEEAID